MASLETATWTHGEHVPGPASRGTDARRALREAGLRVTEQRLRVYEALQKAARPMSHPEMVALLPPTVIEVETNGTVAPHAALDALVAQYNVSPKLAHSGNPAALALPADRLDAWAREPRAVFKFVVAEPEDVAEVLDLQARHAIPSARLYLMPEGRDGQTLRRRAGWLAELCSTNELSFSDRLHIHLFGDTRGT